MKRRQGNSKWEIGNMRRHINKNVPTYKLRRLGWFPSKIAMIFTYCHAFPIISGSFCVGAKTIDLL